MLWLANVSLIAADLGLSAASTDTRMSSQID
jgi:hypothetical protein